MTAFSDTMTLAEARDQLRQLAYEGTDCPCCTRRVRVYRRKLSSVAARGVAALYKSATLDWAHMPTVAREHLADVQGQGGYVVLSHHWGLLEEEIRRRPDGGRTGYWRVTALGALWLRGEESVPMFADIYDGRCLRLHGDLVTVQDVLGQHFSFSELMHPGAADGAQIDLFKEAA